MSIISYNGVGIKGISACVPSTVIRNIDIGTESDVANAVIFLLSEASKWITGTNLIVDGGYSAK